MLTGFNPISPNGFLPLKQITRGVYGNFKYRQKELRGNIRDIGYVAIHRRHSLGFLRLYFQVEYLGNR